MPIPTTKTHPQRDLEADLLNRARAGDGQAFAMLVKEHMPVMYRIAHRLVPVHDGAQDVVQDALSVFFRIMDRYTPGTSLRAFLAAIVVRQAHTFLRSENRRKTRERKFGHPASSDTPLEQAQANQLADAIKEGLMQLSDKQRQVVLLRMDGKLNYSQIAQAVSSTEGSVRVIAHQAMKKLREIIQVVGVLP